MYCMVKGNHVYTLNYNLTSLEQKMNAKPEFVVKAHSDYHIRERQEKNYKMIYHVDDLIELVKMMHTEEKPSDKIVLNLIYKGDRVIELLYQIKDAGYDPSIKYEGGKLTHIGLTLEKKIHILIRTQQLAPSNNDGECNVSSAEIYNNMSSAMNKLNNALFKAEHKSYYSKQDVDILDEYRTVVPVGLFQSAYDKVEQDKIKSNIYDYGNIIASYERTIKRPHNPKYETEQEYKNTIMSCTRDNQLFQVNK